MYSVSPQTIAVTPAKYQSALPAGYMLRDYKIEKKLAQGGFGITYLATETFTGRNVVIKENFPEYCSRRDIDTLQVLPNDERNAGDYRWALEHFQQEAKMLAELEHPNIVTVQGAFPALGTAYYIMKHIHGTELQIAAPAPADITGDWLQPILCSLLSALNYLHTQPTPLLHRDIKPSNILLTANGRPILIDFGLSRMNKNISSVAVGSEGYTPCEQYSGDHDMQGAWTDLYALGATCYHLITGEVPPVSFTRILKDTYRPLSKRKELRKRFSATLLGSIDKALNNKPEERWQTAQEWLNNLQGEKNSRNTRKSRKGWGKAAIIVIPLALIGLLHTLQEDDDVPTDLPAPEQPIIHIPPRNTPELPTESPEQLLQKAGQYYNDKNFAEAVKLLNPLAEQGLPEAQYKLGNCYYNGWGVEKNLQQSVEWYRKAGDRNHAEAQNNLGYCYQEGRGVGKNLQQAVHWYRKSAEQGLSKAQHNLGFHYQHGWGVEKDMQQAVHWYRKAAEQNHAVAQNSLGLCYKKGLGVEKDPQQAVYWYRKAAEQNLADAQNNLGFCYEKGQGVEKDLQQAVYWYRKASEQNLANAQYNLGLCYENGWGVEIDPHQALTLYLKAAEQNHTMAQYWLGVCYTHGRNVEKDLKKAFEWYHKAAELNYARAQHSLGDCYHFGKGVEKNEQQAVYWYRKAAEQNLADAQN